MTADLDEEIINASDSLLIAMIVNDVFMILIFLAAILFKLVKQSTTIFIWV